IRALSTACSSMRASRRQSTPTPASGGTKKKSGRQPPYRRRAGRRPLVFADLDETLRQLLYREVPLGQTDVAVVFERPDRGRGARFRRPRVDLFLYDLSENRDLRETGWNATLNGNGGATLRWPPLRVDLRFLVTVWAQEVEDEHRLLYHLYRTLRRVTEVPA